MQNDACKTHFQLNATTHVCVKVVAKEIVDLGPTGQCKVRDDVGLDVCRKVVARDAVSRNELELRIQEQMIN